MDKPTIDTSGEDFILSFTVNGQEGTIDNVNKTVTVFMPVGTDLTCLAPVFVLSDGAQSNIPSGSTVDFTMPVIFKITNGNTYIDYTVTVKCYEAVITSFTLTDTGGTQYTGVIDDENLTITVYLTMGTDVTRLKVNYTLSDLSECTPATGSTLDFTEPVEFTVTNHGVEAVYTVTALATDMPVTAFIGTAATVSALSDEEKAAAEWMLANVPRAEYISMQDIISGAVVLDPGQVKALWWHLDYDDWPSQGWDSRDAIKTYYANGGSLFLSRYACKYINDVYQIALDEKEPNAKSRYDVAQVLQSPLGFIVDDAGHAVFEGMSAEPGEEIFLIDTGFATTNCQVDWNIWDYPDHSLEGWELETGGKRLAYEADDGNKTAIVEFPATTSTAGRVILVGTGGFEWNIANDGDNGYSANRIQLTENILNYLTGIEN
ncbi:MAG: DUF4960 domain-containing protein [Prevotellaceae bacterium]|nr:DUF4960 domain-containing protein [Prevotellaceae bacterium]